MKKQIIFLIMFLILTSNLAFSQIKIDGSKKVRFLLGVNYDAVFLSEQAKFSTQNVSSSISPDLTLKNPLQNSGTSPFLGSTLGLSFGVEILRSLDLYLNVKYGIPYISQDIYSNNSGAKNIISLRADQVFLDLQLRYTFYFGKDLAKDKNRFLNIFGVYLGAGGGLVMILVPRVVYTQIFDNTNADSNNTKDQATAYLKNIDLVHYDINLSSGLMFRITEYLKLSIGYKFNYYFNSLFGENNFIYIKTNDSTNSDAAQIQKMNLPNATIGHALILNVDFIF